MKNWSKFLLFITSMAIVAFGQPAWSPFLGLVAALVGFALFWRLTIDQTHAKQRFLLGTIWFGCIQLIQLSWFASHPYYYIYFVLIGLAALLGLQFGLFCIFVTPARLASLRAIFALAALWTLFEWVRLFFFSGFTWNPVGLALAGYLVPLQMASIWGVFGLSFWVMLVNLLALRAWLYFPKWKDTVLCLSLGVVPYLFGIVILGYHDYAQQHQKEGKPLIALLMQPNFLAEESLEITSPSKMLDYVYNEWHQILELLRPYLGRPIDLIVFPEGTVPYGTYTATFGLESVQRAFQDVLGSSTIHHFPSKNSILARAVKSSDETHYFVSNGFWAQAIANIFHASVLIGLEDADDLPSQGRVFYMAAQYFRPSDTPEVFPPARYEKRILVPLGEYIPFSFCRDLASCYGITGSFLPGKSAKVFSCSGVPFGTSICYEETFGSLMRENRLLGASFLVNLTNDVWYPNSRLTHQHFSLALLRTVENGMPLLRSCNNGITTCVDSLGRQIAMLDEEKPGALLVAIPQYTYTTLYTYVGDRLIIALCLIALLVYAYSEKTRIMRY